MKRRVGIVAVVGVGLVAAGLAAAGSAVADSAPPAPAVPAPNLDPGIGYADTASGEIVNGGVRQSWVHQDLRPSADVIDVVVPAGSSLWEDNATLCAKQGTVTPMIPFVVATDAHGGMYESLWQVPTLLGMNPTNVDPGQCRTGKVYFLAPQDVKLTGIAYRFQGTEPGSIQLTSWTLTPPEPPKGTLVSGKARTTPPAPQTSASVAEAAATGEVAKDEKPGDSQSQPQNTVLQQQGLNEGVIPALPLSPAQPATPVVVAGPPANPEMPALPGQYPAETPPSGPQAEATPPAADRPETPAGAAASGPLAPPPPPAAGGAPASPGAPQNPPASPPAVAGDQQPVRHAGTG